MAGEGLMDSGTVMRWRHHLTLDLPPTRSGSIWIHACSMGEVASVTPLIRALITQGEQMHLTVVTKTGFANACRLLADELAARTLTVAFISWDLPRLMERMITRLQPKGLLLTETEFWPGMLAACRRHSVVVVSINTRISDRSFPRYYATRWLWRRWLAPIALFLPQSIIDGERLVALGIAAERVVACGNLKTAVTPPVVDASSLRQRIDPSESRPILLIASSHDGEERELLAQWSQWQQQQPNLLVLLVPRHPERFDIVVEECQQLGFSVCRWSADTPLTADDTVMVVDAMGVLGKLFTIADLVVIGGSIANYGGHNPLEAAVCGRGVITGPHVQNFQQLMDDMSSAGGAVVAADGDEVGRAVTHLLSRPDAVRQLHSHAARWMQQHGAVLPKVLQHINRLLDSDPIAKS
ncbi:MAG: 3-deoxy-D-manno-octulosonic acid transferase, partial [Mariprofundales bacterium]|nr:3-deoxy-D-manno-octulosonic acid transferase [Mariprofundales bacterium]